MLEHPMTEDEIKPILELSANRLAQVHYDGRHFCRIHDIEIMVFELLELAARISGDRSAELGHLSPHDASGSEMSSRDLVVVVGIVHGFLGICQGRSVAWPRLDQVLPMVGNCPRHLGIKALQDLGGEGYLLV